MKIRGKSYLKFGIIGLIWLLIFSLRTISLDADLPNYGITFYQQVDEGAYAYLALNKLNYGVINPDIFPENMYQFTAPHLRTNLVGNLLAYWGMCILGKNYYGFRISSITAMLINYLLIWKLLFDSKQKYWKDDKKGNLAAGFFILLLTLDFTFNMASRVVETSPYRMTAVLICMYIYYKLNNYIKTKYFLMGFVSVFSVFGIYITNIFLVFSCGFLLLYEIRSNGCKKTLISMFSYCLGGLAALGLCQMYMAIFWKTNIVANTISIISNFSSVDGYINSGTSGRINYIINFFASNYNLYNLGILFLFLCLLPYCIKTAFKDRDGNIAFNIFIILCFFLQTIISEDYIFRKYIIIVPSVIYLIYTSIGNENQKNDKLSNKSKAIQSTYIIISAIVCIFFVLYRFKIINDGSRLDVTFYDKAFITAISTFEIFALAFLFWRHKIYGVKWKLYWYISVAVLMMFVNIYMCYNYIYTNITYADRDIMIKLSELELDNKHIVGYYMLGFSLYNTYIPVVNNAANYGEILEKNPEWYYFDYSTSWNPGAKGYIDSILSGTGYHLKEEIEFPRCTKTLGTIRNVSLFIVEEE